MKFNLNTLSIDGRPGREAEEAGRALGKRLARTPEYEAFLKASRAMNEDLEAQRMRAEMRPHYNFLRWNPDDGQHGAELAVLKAKMEGLPTVVEFRRTEEAIVRMMRAVDEMVSQQAGVSFAANAKHRGCCG